MFDPAYPQEFVDRVIIEHPAYSDAHDLLSFYAWDNGSGIHLGTVLLACRLVACNEFDGFLTKDRNGTQQITKSEDSVLEPGIYFFHVRPPQPDIYRYPIYPSFKEWRYPHNCVPNSWVGSWTRTTVPSIIDSTSNNSLAVIARDKKCCVSGYQDGLERAHLCPQAEKEWFTENNMQEYNSCLDLATEYFINDQVNSVSLRLDIQQCFAKGDFVIVRKEGNWVAHFLRPTNQLGGIFHNRQVTINAAIAPHFLLVHFAWSMFPFVANMFATNRNRLVRLRESDEGGEVKERDYELSGYRIMEITKKKDSRNKKRRNDGQQDAEEAILSEVSTENTLRDSEGTTSNTMSAEDRYIAGLKRRALREQRPFDYRLICCDYDAAENAAALGLPTYLCLECLGEELVVMPEDV
ncbi:hypothetical protein V8E54_009691 [Elaphomyces granulatus]|jgi:hypothetical protein